MSNLKIIQGDLIKLAKQGKFDMIFHGCNCFCTMGSGIARSISEEFPEAYLVDRGTTIGSATKLGTYTSAKISSMSNDLWVYNLYTQYDFGTEKVHFEYAAFEILLRKIEIQLSNCSNKYRLGFPLIGCGLAGGNPDTVTEMLEEFAYKVSEYGHSVTLVEYANQ